MKKILWLLVLIWCSSLYANEVGMAQDILAQIIRGPVNTDPDLSEAMADQTVLLSLRASAITLACMQQFHVESEGIHNACINRNKTAVLSAGELSDASFKVGRDAADQQAKIHREVNIKGYTIVIREILAYIKNLTNPKLKP